MRLSQPTKVRCPAGQRQTAVLRSTRPAIVGRRRVCVAQATLKLGSRKGGDSSGTEAVGGLSGLLGTITRSLSRQGSRPAPKDDKTVFVAGATGRLGARVLRELLAAGFKVRAAARDVDQAEANTDIAVQFGLIAPDQLSRLTWVEMDLDDPDSIRPAIGGATKVISCVGAPESAPLDPSGPRRIDGDGSVALVEAAAAAGVKQFVMVTSLGTGKVGFPASVLNLFWGVLSEKRKAEQALERSGMSYTIVRPGGMERPKDDYKETHNLVLKPRDTIFGGQVSRLQVAELVTAAVINPELSENKCVEVVAETTAPELGLETLWEQAATEISKEDQEELAAVEAEARQVLSAAQQELAEAQEALAVTSDKVSQLNESLKEAKSAEKEVRGEVAGVLREGRAAQQALQAAEAAAEKAARQESAARAVLEAAKKAGAAGELLSQRDLQQLFQQALNPPKEQPAQKAASPVPFGLFGSRPTTPAVQEEEEEEIQVAAAPSLPFAGLFGAKRAPVQVEEEEEEEKEEEVVEVARPTSPFAALFGGQKAKQVVVEEEEEVEEEVEEEAPARPASPFAAFFGAKPAAPAKEEEKAPAPAKPAPAPAAEKAEASARPASPWAGLFGGSQAIQVGDDTRISVPDREGSEAQPAPAAQKAAAPVAAPAAAAAAAAAASAAAAAAADQKRKAAVEEAKKALQQEKESAAAAEAKSRQDAAAAAQKREQEERETRLKAEADAKAEAEARERVAAAAAEQAAAEANALAGIRAEREEEARKAAEAKAKAEADARAKALAAQKAAAEKAQKEQAAAAAAPKPEAPKPEAPKPAAAAPPAPKPAAPAAKKADAEVPANVQEARQWIANWRSKQGKGGAPPSSTSTSSSKPAAAPAASSSGSNGAPVPPNVQEAREWIANWRAKGSSNSDSGSGGEPAAEQQQEEEVQVVQGEDLMGSVTKFFQGFGGAK